MTAAALTPNPSPPAGEGDPAAELLAFLRAAGFAVEARDGKVYVTPRAKLSPAECGQIVSLKPGLLLLLAAERWEECPACLAGVDRELCGELPFAVANCRNTKRGGCPYRRKPK
jgi:hypothetical protein